MRLSRNKRLKPNRRHHCKRPGQSDTVAGRSRRDQNECCPIPSRQMVKTAAPRCFSEDNMLPFTALLLGGYEPGPHQPRDEVMDYFFHSQ